MASIGSHLARFPISNYTTMNRRGLSGEALKLNPQASLRVVKLIHTIAWAFFAGCIMAIPVLAFRGEFTVAGVLIAIVFVEVAIILFNDWRCPLTAVAARYTDDRRDNFDIYLPLWLARYNKQIFGGLFVLGLVYTFLMWRAP
jgi:hypothetical protein